VQDNNESTRRNEEVIIHKYDDSIDEAEYYPTLGRIVHCSEPFVLETPSKYEY
jgi:hypothetical protein